jgi:drug/metabolite transporter (DMT)-like permease
VLAIVAGSQTVLGKFALERIPLFGYTAGRFLIAYVLICIAMRVTGRKLPWHKIGLFAPLAILWIATGTTFILGLQRTNATTTQFIHTAIPIITAIFAWFILRHRLSKIQWLGVITAFFGIVVVVTSTGSVSLENTNFLGNILIFLSAIGFALYAVLTKLSKYRSVDPFEMIFIGFTFGIPIALPFAVAEYVHVGNWLPEVSTSAWVALVLASVGMTFFATVFQVLINRIGPSYAALNQYLNPIVVIFWAALLLNELPEMQALIGASVTLAGVGLVTWQQRKEDRKTSAAAVGSAE